MGDARDSTRADHLAYELSEARQKIAKLEDALFTKAEYPPRLRYEAVQLVRILKDVIWAQLIQPTTHCPTEDSPFRQAERFLEKYGTYGKN